MADGDDYTKANKSELKRHSLAPWCIAIAVVGSGCELIDSLYYSERKQR